MFRRIQPVKERITSGNNSQGRKRVRRHRSVLSGSSATRTKDERIGRISTSKSRWLRRFLVSLEAKHHLGRCDARWNSGPSQTCGSILSRLTGNPLWGPRSIRILLILGPQFDSGAAATEAGARF